MSKLKKNQYLMTNARNFDYLSSLVGGVGVFGVFYAVISLKGMNDYFDPRSIMAVIGGTIGVLIFQYNFSVIFKTIKLTSMALIGLRDKKLLKLGDEVDQAIVNRSFLSQLREAEHLNGDYINDTVFMLQNGLVFDEIESFFSSKISNEYYKRDASLQLLKKGAAIAPALGLFGTVIGLIGVLKNLSDPSQIGPSMSLALLTTAYGAGLGSLFFTPLHGRVERFNQEYLDFHEQLMKKLKILVLREERRLDKELLINHKEDVS